MISRKMPIFVYHLANTSNYLIVFNRVSRYEPFFLSFFRNINAINYTAILDVSRNSRRLYRPV